MFLILCYVELRLLFSLAFVVGGFPSLFLVWLACHAVVGVFDYPNLATLEIKYVFLLSVLFFK